MVFKLLLCQFGMFRNYTNYLFGQQNIRVHCTFRMPSGVVLVVGTGVILRKSSSFEDLVKTFTHAILPVAIALSDITQGSVCSRFGLMFQ